MASPNAADNIDLQSVIELAGENLCENFAAIQFPFNLFENEAVYHTPGAPTLTSIAQVSSLRRDGIPFSASDIIATPHFPYWTPAIPSDHAPETKTTDHARFCESQVRNRFPFLSISVYRQLTFLRAQRGVTKDPSKTN
jgi:hypothetical protein